MRTPLSKKIIDIQPSGIRKFFDVANEMEDAISLGVGEPDFDTPWRIREEASSLGTREDVLYFQRRAEGIKRGDLPLYGAERSMSPIIRIQRHW